MEPQIKNTHFLPPIWCSGSIKEGKLISSVSTDELPWSCVDMLPPCNPHTDASSSLLFDLSRVPPAKLDRAIWLASCWLMRAWWWPIHTIRVAPIKNLCVCSILKFGFDLNRHLLKITVRRFLLCQIIVTNRTNKNTYTNDRIYI